MFRFLHAADIHLDSPLQGLERYEGAPVDEIRGATRRALENLVETAIQQQVDFVVIAGDLYDGDWRDHNTGLYFVKQMTRLRDAGIPLYLIAGNHDAANKMTRSLRLPLNSAGDSPMFAHATAETRRLDDLGVAIHGRSFANAAEQGNLAREYPDAVPGYFNIGLLHTSAEGDALHDTYAPCTIDDMRERQYQYWALGHIHGRRVLCTDPYIAFAGNVQGRHIRETGEKGCLLVSVDDQHRVEVEFHALDVYRWDHCVVDCTGAESADDLLARFHNELYQLLHRHDGYPMAIRILLSGACTLHQDLAARHTEWANELRAAAIDVARDQVWIEKLRVSTTYPRRIETGPRSGGPVEELLAYLDELAENESQLLLLGNECDELRRKLATELPHPVEGLSLNDPKQLLEIVQSVKPLLLQRLAWQETC